MATIKAGNVENGMFILYKENPHSIIERTFVKTGRGGAHTKTKLRNLISGSVIQETFNSQDAIEEIEVIDSKYQYLYKEGDNLVMMNNDTFEQEELEAANFKDKLLFLKEGESYILSKWGEKVLELRLPPKMTFEVIEVAEAIKGDTVGSVKTDITLETGLVIKGPVFIKVGEKIRVNEFGEYSERVKD